LRGRKREEEEEKERQEEEGTSDKRTAKGGLLALMYMYLE